MSHTHVTKLNALEASYTKASLISYQSLLLADYLGTHLPLSVAQGPQVDPAIARLLPHFVSSGKKLPGVLSSLAEKLGNRASHIDKIITEKSEEVLKSSQNDSARKYRTIAAGSPLRSKIDDLSSSDLLRQTARILQTQPEFPNDPGGGNSGNGGSGVYSPVDPGTGGDSGDGSSSSSADATADTGTPYQDFSPDVQQATGQLWNSTAGPKLAPYLQQGIATVQGGGDIDIDQLNAAVTGVIAGIAATAGGLLGAALVSASLIIIPRMLAAVEDAIGDYLVGDLPGF